MRNLIAQVKMDLGNPFRGIGPLGLEGKEAGEAPGIFNTFLSGVIGLLTVVAAIWFTFQFLIGAIGIISAGGDKAKVQAARSKIITGVVGLVVVIAAIFAISLVGELIGFNIILNPTAILGE